jgi:hypothetical protein
MHHMIEVSRPDDRGSPSGLIGAFLRCAVKQSRRRESSKGGVRLLSNAKATLGQTPSCPNLLSLFVRGSYEEYRRGAGHKKGRPNLACQVSATADN